MLPLLAAVALIGCKTPVVPFPENEPSQLVLVETIEGARTLARGTDASLWMSVDDQFAVRRPGGSSFEFESRGDLPSGHVAFLGTIDGSREWLFANVFGRGFYRSWAGSGAWEKIDQLRSPTLQLINNNARPVPRDMTTTPEGVTWLATLGGLYISSDEGGTWDSVDLSSAGNTNLLFNAVDAVGAKVIAVSMLPDALIPSNFAGVLSGRVFISDNSGLTWRNADGDFPSNHASAVAIADGTYYVGTMDQGVIRGSGDGTWTPLFGPTDVVDLEWVDGGLNVASASRGLWRLEDDDWTQVGTGPAIGLSNGTGVLRDGGVYGLAEGQGAPPPVSAGGNVHLALSFHMNYYHSYRGDSNTEDGFGRDIRIIRSILDWLDEHPEVHGHWDSDNAFTTDAWAASYSPDILERIRERVERGQDEIRLMSWNNGAMASSTNAEFTRSIQLAKNSNEVAFGSWTPGVQPQENMFSPDDIKRYKDAGIDWVTFFYGANGFTGPRNDITLLGAAAYNPFSLRDVQTSTFITGVPVYHHADMLDHGGLAGWVKQLHDRFAEDTLLVIHFDADGDSWENFGAELDTLEGLDFVRHTKLTSYLGNHDPIGDQALPGDIADGVGDGFSSWGEKAINQQVWALIEESRQAERVARELVPTPSGDLLLDLDQTLEQRLLALSTTNFGLAAPRLHEDRERSALDYATQARNLAVSARDRADAVEPLVGNTLQFINPLDASGPATVPFQIQMPAGAWEGEAGLVLDRAGTPLPIRAFLNRTENGSDVIDVYAFLDLPPHSRVDVDWSYDPAEPVHAQGTLTLFDAPPLPSMAPPMSECRGRESIAQGGTVRTTVDEWGLQVSRREEWSLPTCSGTTWRPQWLSWAKIRPPCSCTQSVMRLSPGILSSWSAPSWRGADLPWRLM